MTIRAAVGQDGLAAWGIGAEFLPCLQTGQPVGGKGVPDLISTGCSPSGVSYTTSISFRELSRQNWTDKLPIRAEIPD